MVNCILFESWSFRILHKLFNEAGTTMANYVSCSRHVYVIPVIELKQP